MRGTTTFVHTVGLHGLHDSSLVGFSVCSGFCREVGGSGL